MRWGSVRSWLVVAACALVSLPAAGQRPLPGELDLTGALDSADLAVTEAGARELMDAGQWESAAALLDDGLALARKVGGPEGKRATVRMHVELGRARLATGDFARAEAAYATALRLARAAGDQGAVHDSQIGLSYVALNRGDAATATRLAVEQANRLEGAGRGRSPMSVDAQLALAMARLDAGDVAGARQALDDPAASASEDHEPGPAFSRVAADVALAEGDLQRAFRELRLVNEAADRNEAVRAIARDPDERHALSALGRLEKDSNKIFTLAALRPDDAETQRLALTVVLRRKALVLDVMAARHRAVARRTDEASRARLTARREAIAELAALSRHPPASDAALARAKQVLELERRVTKLTNLLAVSAELAGSRAGPAALEAALRVEVRDVHAALPAGGALVEMVRYRPFDARARRPDRWRPARYAAIVLRADASVAWVDLGEASMVEALVTKLRGALTNPSRTDTRLLARDADTLLFAPVRARLKGETTVVLAPDAALHLLPFDALVGDDQRWIVEKWSLRYVATGRDLLAGAESARARHPPLVVAAPAFEGEALGALGPAAANATRSVDFAKVRFDPLPGTAGEAERVRDALKGATLLQGAAATKRALSSVQGPSVLHVATHGFFLGSTAPAVATARGADPEPATAFADPLVRSGLALAGANRSDEGIVSALELAALDLDGTELAVLSACETGLGVTQAGEGVFGLRRALAVAGARTQVVSLWKVDDQATLETMATFYERLRAGRGRADAMRDARLEMLQNARRAHPYYWASFVVSGAATPMSGVAWAPRSADASRSAPPPTPAPAVSTSRGCGCELATIPGGAAAVAPWALLGGIFAARRRRRSARAFGALSGGALGR